MLEECLCLTIYCTTWTNKVLTVHKFYLHQPNKYAFEPPLNQICFSGDFFHHARRNSLPSTEPDKNGLPCSHCGKTLMDNGRTGRTPSLIPWCKPYTQTLFYYLAIYIKIKLKNFPCVCVDLLHILHFLVI